MSGHDLLGALERPEKKATVVLLKRPDYEATDQDRADADTLRELRERPESTYAKSGLQTESKQMREHRLLLWLRQQIGENDG